MTVQDTALEIIAASQEYATTILDAATELVKEAQTFAQGWVNLTVHELDWEAPDDLDLAGIIADGKVGALDTVYNPPDDGDIQSPEFLDVYVPDIPIFPLPPSPIDPSSLFKAPLPVWDVDTFSEPAPVFEPAPLPETPAVSYPDDPESVTDDIDVPVIVAPTFDKDVVGVVPEPGEYQELFKSNYASSRPEMLEAAESFVDAFISKYAPTYQSGLSTLEAKLSADIGSPGNALSATWEDAAYERERDRRYQEQLNAKRVVESEAGARGFVLPPGAMYAGLLRVEEDERHNLALASSNIYVERKKLELQHLQTVLNISQAMRQVFISAAVSYMGNMAQINGQAIEYARLVAYWAVELFNEQLSVYNTAIELYKTEAEVYKVRLESAFAELRVFEAEIAAERLKIEVDNSAIELYTAKVNAQKVKIDLYVAQLQGVSELVKQQALEVDIYEAQVRAYAARVQGKSAEYGAYEASLRGDTAKVQVYSEQVRAFSAQVDALTAEINAGRAQSDATIAYNRNLTELFDANVRKYEADLRGESTRVGSEIEIHKTAVTQYLGQLDAEVKLITTQYERDRLALQAAIANLESRMRTSLGQGDLFQKTIEATAQTALAGADVLKGIGAAAVSANNTLVEMVTEE